MHEVKGPQLDGHKRWKKEELFIRFVSSRRFKQVVFFPLKTPNPLQRAKQSHVQMQTRVQLSRSSSAPVPHQIRGCTRTALVISRITCIYRYYDRQRNETLVMGVIGNFNTAADPRRAMRCDFQEKIQTQQTQEIRSTLLAVR